MGMIALAMMCGGDGKTSILACPYPDFPNGRSLMLKFPTFIAGVADIVGRKFGVQKLPYNAEKSWAGSVAMCTFGFLVSLGWVAFTFTEISPPVLLCIGKVCFLLCFTSCNTTCGCGPIMLWSLASSSFFETALECVLCFVSQVSPIFFSLWLFPFGLRRGGPPGGADGTVCYCSGVTTIDHKI